MQMPYLVTETRAFLESRRVWRDGGESASMYHSREAQDPRFRIMWTLADHYGPQSQVDDENGTLHMPQTLDQSYLTTDRLLDDLDYDQVVYRYTDDAGAHGQNKSKAKPSSDNTEPKLLMVNQLWVWRLDCEQSNVSFMASLLSNTASQPWL
jgi:hypothetical protein